MRRIFIFFSLLLIFNSCLSMNKDKKNISVKVKMSSLEEELIKNFPIKKDLQIGNLQIMNPSFIGKNKNREKLDLSIAFKFSNILTHQNIEGEIKVSSSIHYNSKNFNLYLKDTIIENFKIGNFALSQFITSNIQTIISKIIIEEIIKYPIYNLNKSSKLSFVLKFLKTISIKDSHILLSFGI